MLICYSLFLLSNCFSHILLTTTMMHSDLWSPLAPPTVRVNVRANCVLCAQVCGICAFANQLFFLPVPRRWRNEYLAEKKYKKPRTRRRWLLPRYTTTQTNHVVLTCHSTRPDVLPHPEPPLSNMREPRNHPYTRAGPGGRHT